MKSFSDDLPNVTKQEVERAANTAQEAVHLSRETLASSIEHAVVSQRNSALLKGALFLGILHLVVDGGIVILLVHHILG